MKELKRLFSLMQKIDSTYEPHSKVLLEDKRTKQAEERSINVIRQFFNNADWLDKEFVHQDNPNHFKSVFKPNDKWTKLLATAQQRLQNGENPKNVFDKVFSFRKGFARVKLNDKWNFINQKIEIISNQWFDYVSDFNEGFAKVQLNNKWYKLDKNGNLYEINESKTYNVRSHKKQVIRLTEGDLHRIIKESINKIIKVTIQML